MATQPSLINKEELDKDQLLKQFGELINSLKPKIETQASEAGLSITLRFDAKQTDNSSLRRLAALVVDNVA